ncbi:MAG: hypothetical protein INR68_01700 [Methylobacterium mesophilicum]|nr:hypothetical protein [Methylobacterium mesophilicum]
MRVLRKLAKLATTIREFIAPSYRPERHYMRGPGPACARSTPLVGTPLTTFNVR